MSFGIGQLFIQSMAVRSPSMVLRVLRSTAALAASCGPSNLRMARRYGGSARLENESISPSAHLGLANKSWMMEQRQLSFGLT
jgi:hypothetical protein